MPGFEPVIPWLGVLAPAGTSPALIDKINKDVREILTQPAVKAQLAKNGLTVADGTPQGFAAQLRSDHERLRSPVGKVLKREIRSKFWAGRERAV